MINEIYTDGSTKPKNPGNCGCGLVITKNGQLVEQKYFYIGHGTNNIAELSAVKFGIEYLQSKNLDWEDCTIYTDSSYAVGVLTKNWKAQKNQELILNILTLLNKSPNINVKWVKGHSTNLYNELADQMANQAVDLMCSSE